MCTCTEQEWHRDFDYKYAADDDPLYEALFGTDGHVHEGCFEVFKMLHREITEVLYMSEGRNLEEGEGRDGPLVFVCTEVHWG